MIPTLPLLKTALQHPSNLPRLPTLPKPLSVLRPASKPVSQPFKRSQWGLFDGKTKRYGNNVPHSKHKTRRTWMPNIQTQTLWSESINGGRGIKVRVTARAGRSIKKAGGLDPYLLTTPSTTLGFLGNHLRQLVLSSRAVSSAIPSPTTGRITKEERYVTRKLLNLDEKSEKELTLGEMKKMREEAWKEMRRTGYTGGVPVESITDSQEIIQFMEARKRGEYPKRPSTFAATVSASASSSTAGASATAELNVS